MLRRSQKRERQPSIISIMTNFKDNVQIGQVYVEFDDGTMTSFEQNEKRQICQIQTFLPKGNRTYNIFKNHVTNETYCALDLKNILQCKHIGHIFGISCVEGHLQMENGFPHIVKDSFEKNVTFDINFITEEKNYFSTNGVVKGLTKKCYATDHLSSWLQVSNSQQSFIESFLSEVALKLLKDSLDLEHCLGS